MKLNGKLLDKSESKLAHFEYILSYFSIMSLFWLFSSRWKFGADGDGL